MRVSAARPAACVGPLSGPARLRKTWAERSARWCWDAPVRLIRNVLRGRLDPSSEANRPLTACLSAETDGVAAFWRCETRRSQRSKPEARSSTAPDSWRVWRDPPLVPDRTRCHSVSLRDAITRSSTSRCSPPCASFLFATVSWRLAFLCAFAGNRSSFASTPSFPMTLRNFVREFVQLAYLSRSRGRTWPSHAPWPDLAYHQHAHHTPSHRYACRSRSRP